MKSSNPRKALTGVPSAARKLSGTPKNARKYNEAVSRSMILRSPTGESWHDSAHGEARPPHPRAASAGWPDVLHRHRQGDRAIHFSGSAAGTAPRATWRDQGLSGNTRGRRAWLDGDRLRGDKPFDPSQPDDAPDRLQHISEIISCYSVAGDASYLLKVQVENMSQLESLLARIRSDGKVSTHTTTVLSVPFEDRPQI